MLLLEWSDLLANISTQNRNAMVVLGLAAFAGGVLLMIRHKRDIDEVHRNERDPKILKFEQRKFRRRSLASTMVASMGVMLISLYWARDPYVFATLISLVLILLLTVMFLASLDLLSVGLHSISEDDKDARQKMVDEYVRQREKLLDKVAENEDEEVGHAVHDD